LNRLYSLIKREVERNLSSGAGRPPVWLAVSLLVLSAVSIVTMPLTQYLWSWDRFMRGGQDFELGALMVLTLLCLALVLPRLCKQSVQSLVARTCHASRILRSLQTSSAGGEFLIFAAIPFPASAEYNIPLQI
jgi:hypothetical protein